VNQSMTGFVLMQWNISRKGVVLTFSFMKLAVIAPTTVSNMVFGETPAMVAYPSFSEGTIIVVALADVFLCFKEKLNRRKHSFLYINLSEL